MEKEYKSLSELYEHVLPALRCKQTEIKLNNKVIIKESDIFNYLKMNIWKNSISLSIADIVNDILNTDNEILIKNANRE